MVFGEQEGYRFLMEVSEDLEVGLGEEVFYFCYQVKFFFVFRCYFGGKRRGKGDFWKEKNIVLIEGSM